MKVLSIDVGGSHVKILVSGQKESRSCVSGPTMSATKMVKDVLVMARGWSFDAVSIGYPGPVLSSRPMAEPHNLAPGWMGMDFETAFGCPVKIINDAAMQALGSFQGGKMLFLGLGTGLGSTLVVDGLVEALELGHLPYKKGTYEDYVGLRGLKKRGKKKWRKDVAEVVAFLSAAFMPDEVVLGGGNAKLLKVMPPNCRLGENKNAFLGGFALWQKGAAAGQFERAKSTAKRRPKPAARVVKNVKNPQALAKAR